MSAPIRSVAVLGAGVMGSGIAAHLANAGIPALLLDIVPPDLGPEERRQPAARNRFAAGGLEKAVKARPAAFFHSARARLVTVGNLEDDLGKLAGVDLVIEAVLERLDVKQELFSRLEKVIGEHTIVASNTSGLPIARMTEGRSAGFKKNFLVTHFFNPPRYMKLLELVAGPDTDPAVFARVRRFGEDLLGKGIVVAKDTPNFIGNRVGAYGMMVAIHQMLADGLLPEDVDAIAGEPMARPKSAAFRTADVVGLDTFVHVADNCHAGLTADEEREVFKVPAYIRQMIDRKLLGDKTKSGFYRKNAAGAIETLDPKTGEYRAKQQTPAVAAAVKALKGIEDPAERMRKLVTDTGPAGQFAWKVTAKTLAYSARRIPEITDDLTAVDDAMRWGYNWDLGPFETWDALGFAAVTDRMVADGVVLPDWVKKMRAAGAASFYKGAEVWSPREDRYVARPVDLRTAPLALVRKGEPLFKNGGGGMWDLGDGIAGVTLATKANSVDNDVVALLNQAVERAERDFRGLVLYNQGEHFSVGANLFMVVVAAGQKNWEQIRGVVKQFQGVNQRMKYAAVPVVAAPYGITVAGGLEMCLGAGHVQAAAETYAGLVEVGVGLIPGGAGCLNLLWKALESVPQGVHVDSYALVTQVFKNIALATVATSADEAKELGYFRKTDGVTFDKARLLHDAKARAIGLAETGYHPPAPRAYTLPGDSGIATLGMMIETLQSAGQASAHDALVAKKLATVLCGGVDGAVGPVAEERILELEQEAFVSLCGEPKSQERMQYMLMNNKPLRN